ncbi:hypothetical protein DRQ09_10110 [candidate division KSB1 bacterium]|nr:MAG: hypothetical protein DRQ09_10110 [candidate division KSB1 bacterium]
MFSVTGNIIR